MPLELRDCFAIEMDKFIYVAGGFDNNGGRSNRVYCFDETKNSSHGIPWTLKTFANGRINNVVLAKSEGKLYFMINNKHIHTYDPSQNIWTKVNQSQITIQWFLNSFRSFQIGSFAQSTDVFQIVDYFGQLYAFWYDSKQTGNEKSTFGRMKFLEECTLENSCKVIWDNSGLGLSFVYWTIEVKKKTYFVFKISERGVNEQTLLSKVSWNGIGSKHKIAKFSSWKHSVSHINMQHTHWRHLSIWEIGGTKFSIISLSRL